MGLDYLLFPFLKHMIIEIFQNKKITNAQDALIEYWLPTVRRESELHKLEQLIKKITGKRVNPKDYKFGVKSWANEMIHDLDPKEKLDEDGEFIKLSKVNRGFLLSGGKRWIPGRNRQDPRVKAFIEGGILKLTDERSKMKDEKPESNKDEKKEEEKEENPSFKPFSGKGRSLLS